MQQIYIPTQDTKYNKYSFPSLLAETFNPLKNGMIKIARTIKSPQEETHRCMM